MSEIEGENVMDDFVPDSDISIQQILNNLLSGDINLDLKTDVKQPQKLAALKSFTHLLDRKGFSITSRILRKYIEYYLRYMVSYNRKSREEVIDAIKGMLERERPTVSFQDSLTQNLKED